MWVTQFACFPLPAAWLNVFTNNVDWDLLIFFSRLQYQGTIIGGSNKLSCSAMEAQQTGMEFLWLHASAIQITLFWCCFLQAQTWELGVIGKYTWCCWYQKMISDNMKGGFQHASQTIASYYCQIITFFNNKTRFHIHIIISQTTEHWCRQAVVYHLVPSQKKKQIIFM